VTEEGSLLSHGANLAREYGIPAVLGVSGVTRAVKTGDRVTVDGTNGSVVIDDRAGES
jgi:pyruvate,water dikinase